MADSSTALALVASQARSARVGRQAQAATVGCIKTFLDTPAFAAMTRTPTVPDRANGGKRRPSQTAPPPTKARATRAFAGAIFFAGGHSRAWETGMSTKEAHWALTVTRQNG